MPVVFDVYSLVVNLYDYFKLGEVNKLTDGQTLRKLISTRWSGHLLSLDVIKSNFNMLCNVFADLTTNRNVSHEWRIRAIGLLREVQDEKIHISRDLPARSTAVH